MLKVAVYGKGGIGKSTITSNLAAAFAAMGKKVIQIGCDPKADSTINLLGGEPLRPVMNFMREEDEEPERLEDISKEGFGGVLCIETGGPTPGLGCAGRGIIATFQLLEDLKLFETYKPDVVLYDVLGDVVCGGFAAPIREGYAEKVLIVTSGEKMALYAANNISSAVRNFEDRSYARIFGIVLNHRNVENETEKVQALQRRVIFRLWERFREVMRSSAMKIKARLSSKATEIPRSVRDSLIWPICFWKMRRRKPRTANKSGGGNLL